MRFIDTVGTLLIAVLPASCSAGTNSNPNTAFEAFDSDHNGLVSRPEWVRHWQLAADRLPSGPAKNNGIEATDRLFADLDTNHDGLISVQEWREGNFQVRMQDVLPVPRS